jgi:penicillin-binding protein 1C
MTRRLPDLRAAVVTPGAPPVAAALLVLLVIIVIPTKLFKDDYSLVVTDRDGELLGAVISGDGSWRFPPVREVPVKFEKALLAFEDKRFYDHAGVDFLALCRAIWLDVSLGRQASGASTIPMQIARLGLGNARRGVLQKAAEMLVAFKLDAVMSKKDVLAEFASHAPFGGNVVGLEAAAWRYFGRPSRTLSWAEAATLAVLPNSPSLITLRKNRGLLLDKRDKLLRKLETLGVIDSDTLRLSLSENLPPEPYPIPMLAPHLVFSIKDGDFGAAGGHLVRTSLRKDWQVRASEIVRQHLGSLAANGVRNAALVILENDGGKAVAYVGNTPDVESVDGGHVDILQQPRSTGSILKPFLYAAMLTEGLLLPEELVPDIPTRFPGFTPENNTRSYRGAVPAYMALARSLNIPAIRLLRKYSLDKFYGDLKALGMTTLFRPASEYGLPLIIGGAEGRLWELAGMFAGLARCAAGAEAPFHAPTVFADPDEPKAGGSHISQGAAYLTLDALLRVQRPGAAEAWEEFGSSRKIAWKTGTSQGFRDAWAIGFTRSFTVAVWVGNADGEARPELGGTAAAAPILFAAFDMLPDSAWFDKPMHELKKVEVCVKSGLPPGPHCGARKLVEIPVSAHLPEPCPYCVTVHLDPKSGLRTNAVVERGGPMRNVSWFVLPPAMEWYYRQGNADYQTLPPYKKGAEPVSGLSPLGLIYPQEGSGIYLPRELDGSRGSVVAEAVHRDVHSRVFWHLDSEYLGATEGFHVMSISPAAGEHTLTLVDENGETITRRFTILDRK